MVCYGRNIGWARVHLITVALGGRHGNAMTAMILAMCTTINRKHGGSLAAQVVIIIVVAINTRPLGVW